MSDPEVQRIIISSTSSQPNRQQRVMPRVRGRPRARDGSASSRILAAARGTGATSGGSMTATGLPGLNAGNHRSPLTAGANNGGRVSPSNINESNSNGAGGTQPGNDQSTTSIVFMRYVGGS